MSKMSKFLGSAAVVAVLAGAVAVVGMTASHSSPAQAWGDGTSKTIVGINKGENTLPSPLGFVFNSPLYRPSDLTEVIGSDSGACELLPARNSISDEYMCDTVFTFPNGTVTASGKQRLSDTLATGAVTGGTGAFKGCDGLIIGELYTVTPEPTDFKITLKLFGCAS